MPIIPCCSKIQCPDQGVFNLDYDTPFANLSSELPDQDIFVGLNFGWDNNQPPLGSNWTANSCLGVCTSIVSQQDADDCAARENLFCLNGGGWGTPPGTVQNGGPSGPNDTPVIPPPPGHTPTLFANEATACTANCPDGTPFVFTVPAGIYLAQSQAQANDMAESRACRAAIQARICLSSIVGLGCVNQFFSQTIIVTGGIGPYTFDITGSLPPGLLPSSSNPTNTIISGYPSAIGSTTFQVSVTDSVGNFMTKLYTISILGITNPNLPDGSSGTAYSEQFQADGGTAPFTFQVLVGVLPDGLTMDATGLVTGTPTTANTFDFTVGITSSDGNVCEQDCSITISGDFWKQTTYPPPTLIGPGGAGSGFQNVFNVSGTAATVLAQQIGQTIFNTTPRNSKAHVVVSGMGGFVNGSFGVTHSDFTTVVFDSGPITDGVYDFLFTLPPGDTYIAGFTVFPGPGAAVVTLTEV
jgi:hypothetical protein